MPAASSATPLNPAAASTEGPEPTDCARSARFFVVVLDLPGGGVVVLGEGGLLRARRGERGGVVGWGVGGGGVAPVGRAGPGVVARRVPAPGFDPRHTLAERAGRLGQRH